MTLFIQPEIGSTLGKWNVCIIREISEIEMKTAILGSLSMINLIYFTKNAFLIHVVAARLVFFHAELLTEEEGKIVAGVTWLSWIWISEKYHWRHYSQAWSMIRVILSHFDSLFCKYQKFNPFLLSISFKKFEISRKKSNEKPAFQVHMRMRSEISIEKTVSSVDIKLAKCIQIPS